MNTVVLNEYEARILLAHINFAIYEEMNDFIMKENAGDDELDLISNLFSIRKKCREVVGDD